MSEADLEALWNLGFEIISELETENGILAAGREELYGCVFGRDSLITDHHLLNIYLHKKNPRDLALVKKSLQGLLLLQGREENFQSGEQPGKCIHEFRPNNHERLTAKSFSPWYTYPDGTMKNYDSVDATPLLLIELHRYYEISRDEEFIASAQNSIGLALDWILKYGDSNKDGFVDYTDSRLQPERTHGGLHTQNWMDSEESVFHEDGVPVTFPVAPVEVQGYAYAALMRWSQYYRDRDPGRAIQLHRHAVALKRKFNKEFWVKDDLGRPFLAAGIDGTGKPMKSVRSTMGHCLWASVKSEDGHTDCIVDSTMVRVVVDRLLEPDMFVPEAGIRTLSTASIYFESNSYHNGSIWPHDTSMVKNGFENFEYVAQAELVLDALRNSFAHFKTAIELFPYDHEGFGEYRSPLGQVACKKQAWSAAAMLSASLHKKHIEIRD
jgi:glycogen debranching enzyme